MQRAVKVGGVLGVPAALAPAQRVGARVVDEADDLLDQNMAYCDVWFLPTIIRDRTDCISQRSLGRRPVGPIGRPSKAKLTTHDTAYCVTIKCAFDWPAG